MEFLYLVIAATLAVVAFFIWIVMVDNYDDRPRVQAPAGIFCLLLIVIAVNFAYNSLKVGVLNVDNSDLKSVSAEDFLRDIPRSAQAVEFSDGVVPVYLTKDGSWETVDGRVRHEDYLFGLLSTEYSYNKYPYMSTDDLLKVKTQDKECELAGVDRDLYRECYWVADTLTVKF